MKNMPAQTLEFFRNLPATMLPSEDEPPFDAEDRNRLQHYTVFLLLGIPTMVVFGGYNLFAGNYLQSVFVFASGFGLFVGWLLLRRLENGRPIYRINIILYGVLLLYLLKEGGAGGSRILWMYTFPLIAFFLLGKFEGVFWSGLIFVVSMGLMWIPLPALQAYPYSRGFTIRFGVSFAIVAAIAFWFEYLRFNYREGMQRKHSELEREEQRLRHEIEERKRAEAEKERLIVELQTTLEQVKTLSGLIPICANCKRIRSDEGYWQQVEEYLIQHSDADFSHGICPNCLDELYPEYRGK